MKKESKALFDIHPIIDQRWSPRAFSQKAVEKSKLQSVFEAGRWAASAFNEQPWRFILGQKGDESYEKILESLVPWNQQWAGKAPILVLNCSKKTHARNGNPNVTFKYDLGQAVALMCAEAVNQGLVSHQMSGFDPEKAAASLNIPDDYQAVSVTAIGYYGEIDSLPKDMAEAELKERERIGFESFVFSSFDKPSDLL